MKRHSIEQAQKLQEMLDDLHIVSVSAIDELIKASQQAEILQEYFENQNDAEISEHYKTMHEACETALASLSVMHYEKKDARERINEKIRIII